jgi:S-adenosylmethionine hydrolase
MDAVITLTTDFGLADAYVAAAFLHAQTGDEVKIRGISQ